MRTGARVTASRWVALNLMRAVRGGELLDPAFARLAPQLAQRDRAWTQELVYSTFRLRGRLDYLLAQFVQRPLAQLEVDVLDILRLGAYQLLEMHGVPAYAAVSQAVEMARHVSGRGTTGLVNGVLQALHRAQPDLRPPAPLEAVEFLSSWGAHPRWLIERWLRTFGRAATETLVELNNQRPVSYLRPVGMSVAQADTRLRACEIKTEPVAQVPFALRLDASDVLRALEVVPAVVQDPAAMLVVEYAAFDHNWIADLCAAPGGKTLGLSAQAGPAFVLAGDLSRARLEKARANAHRVGSTDIVFMNADARRPPLRSVPQALLDVPCSGTGTLRRHPDGKWRLGPGDLTALVELQREMLEATAVCIAPGGLLVYATCSLEPEENELQVERFLDHHVEFKLESPGSFQGPGLEGALLRVLPQRHGFDGAFAARLRKTA
ncbi:MAG: 16S rRNA (cytosine(967)-C(5))-methyltransferase RsmB [Longimicrobiales bacterium]